MMMIQILCKYKLTRVFTGVQRVLRSNHIGSPPLLPCAVYLLGLEDNSFCRSPQAAHIVRVMDAIHKNSLPERRAGKHSMLLHKKHGEPHKQCKKPFYYSSFKYVYNVGSQNSTFYIIKTLAFKFVFDLTNTLIFNKIILTLNIFLQSYLSAHRARRYNLTTSL